MYYIISAFPTEKVLIFSTILFEGNHALQGGVLYV